jgi:hypothetical protein
MNVKKIIKEYFKEPFVWLGLSLLIIDVLSGFVSIVNDFRGFLFVNYFYYCFFFPTFYMSSMLMTEPLKKSIKEYRKRKKIGTGLILVSAIFFTLLLNAIPPQFEPHMFFSDEFHVIKIPQIVVELKAYVIIGGLVASPAITVYTKWSVRKQLSKDKIKIFHDVNYGMIFSSSWMIFISLMIVFASFEIFHICFAKGICP